LDANFGAALFRRRPSGSYLTEFGEIVLVRTRRMFSALEAALQSAVGAKEGEGANISSLMIKITTSQMRSLIAVYEKGSFTEAARCLSVSQASLQLAARDLERLLQRVLFQRSAKGATATPTGNELARRIKLAMKEIDYAKDEINERIGNGSSLITIGTLATSGAFLLSRAVDGLLSLHPQSRVRIAEQPYEDLLTSLRAGNIDLLFSVLRKPDWATDVAEQELFSDPYVIAVRPGHPLTRKQSVTRDDLMNYDWVLPGQSTPRYLAFRSMFPSNGDPPPTHIETTSRAVLRGVLTKSDRVTLLTKHEAQFESELGVLAILPFKSKLAHRGYGFATRKDWKPTALQSEFMTLLRKLSSEIVT